SLLSAAVALVRPAAAGRARLVLPLLPVALSYQLLRRGLEVTVMVEEGEDGKLAVAAARAAVGSALEGRGVTAEAGEQLARLPVPADARRRGPARPLLARPAPVDDAFGLSCCPPTVRCQQLGPRRTTAVEVVTRRQTAAYLELPLFLGACRLMYLP